MIFAANNMTNYRSILLASSKRKSIAMHVLKVINLILAFLIEVVVIMAVGVAGLHLENGLLRWVVGIIAPLLLILVWGVYAAPSARKRLAKMPLLIFKIIIFSLGTSALYQANYSTAAAALGIASIINLLLEASFG